MANALKTLAARRPGESNGVRKWRMLTIGDRSRIPPGVKSFHISEFHPSDTQLLLSYLHVAGLGDHFKSYITESLNYALPQLVIHNGGFPYYLYFNHSHLANPMLAPCT